jgi:glycerol-1-phosphate dehydrogenase [NAD(P)+]
MSTGAGALRQASQGWGRFAVVTTPSPWALAEPMLAAPPAQVTMVEGLERDGLEPLAARLAGLERVIGLGGGLAVDAAKFAAWRLDLPLVLVPSSASNNACFTLVSGVLSGGRRAPVRGTPLPEAVVVDPDLVARAPARLNRAGVGDLLSSYTALHDWSLAHRAGRPVDWDEGLATRTRTELGRLVGLAPAVGAGDPDAVLGLLRIGERFAPEFFRFPAARFNAASEHLLAWCLEERTGQRLLHGEIVCLGVLLMAHLQGRALDLPAAVVRAAGVAVQPAAIGTTWEAVEAAVLTVPAYARTVVPWHTVVTELAAGDPTGRTLRARLAEARTRVEALG